MTDREERADEPRAPDRVDDSAPRDETGLRATERRSRRWVVAQFEDSPLLRWAYDEGIGRHPWSLTQIAKLLDLMADRYLCPVCGFPALEGPPWTNDFGSDEICPSCGTHFGYDDAADGDAARREAVYRRLRGRWRAMGCPWFSPGKPAPRGWDPANQLEAVESSD